MFAQEPATLVSTLVEALLPEHLRERHIAHRNKYNSDPRTRLMGEGLDLVGRRANGTTFPVDIMLKPLTHLLEPMVLAVVRDMTDRRAAEETLRKTQAQLAAIVTSSEDAIIGKTLDGIVTSWNEAAERIFGYSANEMIGQSIRRLIPTNRQAEEDMILGRVIRGERVKSYETVRNTRDGRIIDVSITVSPVRDATGQIIGASKIARDVTEQKALLQLCLSAAQHGSWRYDPTRRVYSWDAHAKEIVGAAENDTPLEGFMTWVHPDDAKRVWAAYNAALDPSEPKRSATEYRIRRADGEVRWVRTWGHTYFDLEDTGRERRATSVVGTVADITERKHHEELLQRQADLLNQSHDAILTMQTDARAIVYWNRGAERLYGYTAAEAEGRRTHELLRTRAPIPIQDIDTQVVREGSWYGELTHTTRRGRDIVVESHIVRVSYNGDTFALEMNRDITERKRAEERLRLLMREMNHRAKNMLSVVDAIAHQTASRNPDDFIERFSERIQALSANQELLVRDEWKGIEIRNLVRTQLAHFADLIGSRIAVRGPMLRLKAVGAQAIGLALHELATNAGKYGALSTEAGRVDIRWGTEGETFTMSWTERGGPPVSPPQRRGFGTVVMREMAERSADGKVDLDYAPTGVTWRLTCPAANALEPGEREQISGEGEHRTDRATSNNVKVPKTS
jgi:PAS domain S-box-containing protein